MGQTAAGKLSSPGGDIAARWFRDRSSVWQDWPVDALLAAKGRNGSTISLVVPARDEAETVGPIVARLKRSVMDEVPLVDELVLIDSDSVDRTAAVAADAGATVYRSKDIAPELGSYEGKGEAMWKSLFVTSGDILVFVDGDLTHWGSHFVTGLLGPLLLEPETKLVRAAYTRARTAPGETETALGGRLTELVARPLISLYWPHIAGVAQPLAGEWAARRELLERLTIPVGYGIELSTLLDTVELHGLDSVAQVHLGVRAHRHRSDADMALAATELLAVAEARRNGTTLPGTAVTLRQFPRSDHGWTAPIARPVTIHERPAAASVNAVRA
jgi:glucosyl-3-phosphoglycerate synthase